MEVKLETLKDIYKTIDNVSAQIDGALHHDSDLKHESLDGLYTDLMKAAKFLEGISKDVIGKENLSTQIKEQVQAIFDKHKDMFLQEQGKEVDAEQFTGSGHYEEFKTEAKDILTKSLGNEEITQKDFDDITETFKLESREDFIKRFVVESKEEVNKAVEKMLDRRMVEYIAGRDVDDALLDDFVKSKHCIEFKKDFLMLMRKAFHNKIIEATDFDGLFKRFRLEATEEELNSIISRAPKPSTPAPSGMKWAYDAERDEYILVPES